MSTLTLILHDYPFKWKKVIFKYFDKKKTILVLELCPKNLPVKRKSSTENISYHLTYSTSTKPTVLYLNNIIVNKLELINFSLNTHPFVKIA